MPAEDDRVSRRFEVRRSLKMLVQEAQRQECIEQVRRFPDVFVLFALLDPVIGEAVEQEMVTLQDIRLWLAVLLDGREKHGTVSV
ncbi:MAG TPA: hypothetical protein VIZ18_12575 [Ktedonobacteraceae bacterium]